MTKQLPPIYFYIPQSDWPKHMPESADAHWQIFRKGIYNWTLQAYLRLRAAGFPCQLIGNMPTEGIVLAHRDSLPDDLQPPESKLLIVCLKAERDPHPWAQLHVVQNPKERLRLSWLRWKSYYIPHWPQPALIPRDPTRGDHFENLAYFGHPRNLAPELESPLWCEQLSALGLDWNIVDNEQLNDYSNIDVVLAVRTFDRQDYIEKPATKLFNAWHAGVPAIVGSDSAFQAERKSELDYIQVNSLAETITALTRLRDDKKLRQAMIENGRVRAQETQMENLVKQWRDFITDVAVPTYERWCMASRWTQRALLMRGYLSLKIYRLQFLLPFRK